MVKSRKLVIRLFNAFLVISTLILTFLIANKKLIFGSIPGNWVYPYFLTDLTIIPILLCLVLSTLVISAVYFSKQFVDKYEAYVIIGWVFIGFIVQIALRSIYPFSFGQIIRSDFANAFYNLTFKYSLFELLSRYDEISKTLPFHTVTNMPGKILFFYFLKIFTTSAQTMGYLIVIFSNIGAIFSYYVCKYIFKNKLAALYCLILYLFLPAKFFFFPILNTVSPVFILFSLFLMLKYFSVHKDIYLILLGFSLYAVFIFEPLVLTGGIIFSALLLKYYREEKINRRQLGKLFLYPLLFFVFAHFAVLLIFKYNVVNTFTFILNNQTALNLQMKRGYAIWAIQNLKNFFINAGLAQSILFFVLLSSFLYKIIRNLKDNLKGGRTVKEFILQPGPLIAFSVAILILTVDLLGISRGEIIRLWIFIAVFFQFVAAYFCAVRGNLLTFYIVVIANIFQTAVSIRMVGFVTP